MVYFKFLKLLGILVLCNLLIFVTVTVDYIYENAETLAIHEMDVLNVFLDMLRVLWQEKLLVFYFILLPPPLQ